MSTGDDTITEAEQAREPGTYPEDWQAQGWCCRECGEMAWYAMSLELRLELLDGAP